MLQDNLRLLKAVTDNASVALFIMNERQHCVFMNPAAQRLTGYSMDEVRDRPLHDVIHHTHPDGRHYPLADCPIDRAFPERNQMQGQEVFVHKDGHFYEVAFTASPIRDDTGNPIGTIIEVQDVTERNRVERERRASEARAAESAVQADAERRRLKAVLDAAPVAIFVAAENGAIVEENHAARSIFGEDHPRPADVASYAAWPAWWADGSARDGEAVRPHDWPLARALASGQAEQGTIRMRTFGEPQSERICLVSAAPFVAENGSVRGGIAVLMDLTERVQAEQALREADRRKDEFLAMLAHELRNPLSPIQIAATLLTQGGGDPERTRKSAEIISRQVRHLTSLVDDLLDVSRVTRGLVRLSMEPVAMRPLVLEAVEQVRPLIEQRRHRLTLDAEADVQVLGDGKRIVQVISNLLNNAAKYTPPGGTIGLALQATERDMVLHVSDDGIGMTPELLQTAFDLFAQAQRDPDRSQGGLGIGLALVRRLVQMHGGGVSASSAGPGQGTRFTVRLPRIAPEPATGIDHQAAPPARCGVLNILVVDDNVDAAQTLAMLLETFGHHVVVETSAYAALDTVRNYSPDLCLLDIGLPGMDGMQLARELRALPRLRGATLVAVTGYGQEHDRAEALRAGFDQHLLKPVDIDRLEAVLRSCSAPA